ncbi:endo-1,3-1,4-beta-glycanase ExsH, partial [Cylindrospermopsis raciborskii CHAB3438]|nr:endo-1,3-1,4-beta-glycanase ExsH [Cylindrospermopsis raciborskii CHAB3438]
MTLSLSSPSTVTEDGPQNLFYVFSRTGDTTNSLTVNFNVSGSATLNDDYVQRGATSFGTTTGSVTFTAGSRVFIVSLDPSSDVVSDGNETVALTLAAGTGYALGTSGAVTGTILDNDVAPGTVVRGSIAKILPYRTRHEY